MSSKSYFSIASSYDDDEKTGDESISRQICSYTSSLSAIQDLLGFESSIKPNFLTINAAYRYTFGDGLKCDCASGHSHLTLIVRVRGLGDDRIGIVLQNGQEVVETILPQAPDGHYSHKTWEKSRWHIMKRMLICLYVYDRYKDMKRLKRLVQRPLHVYMLGSIMGKVLDLQKWIMLHNAQRKSRRLAFCGEQDDEVDMLMKKEIS